MEIKGKHRISSESSSEEGHLGFSQQGSGRRVSSDQPQKQQELGADEQFNRLCVLWAQLRPQIRLLNKVCQQPREREKCLHKCCCSGSFSSLLLNYSNHSIYLCKRFQFPKNSWHLITWLPSYLWLFSSAHLGMKRFFTKFSYCLALFQLSVLIWPMVISFYFLYTTSSTAFSLP